MEDHMTDTAQAMDAPATDAEEAAARERIEQALDTALRRFYDKVHGDDLIGPVFAQSVQDWEAHISIMGDFWSRALLGTTRYTRQPFAPHLRMAIGQAHFDRWLRLWTDAANETMPPPLAEHVIAMAGNMSHCWGRALESARAPVAVAD
jgi:hemoglobin